MSIKRMWRESRSEVNFARQHTGRSEEKEEKAGEREGTEEQRARREGKRSSRPLPLILNTSKISQLSHQKKKKSHQMWGPVVSCQIK